MTIRYNPVDVKRAAQGRWLELLQRLGGLTAEQLDPRKNQPCPKCGGKDRFNAFKDVADTGGVNCRNCHDRQNGDGFSTLVWLTGKQFGSVLVEVAEHIGAVPEANGKSHRPKTLGRIVKTYDYRDEAGKMLFQAVRYEPKDFRQRKPKPGPEGGWEWSLGDMRLVPYHLPQLISADREAWVLVVEGEKDVESLEAIGFVATCNPMGAEKWRDSYSEELRGRKVAVLPDNDERGAKHGSMVASSLLKHGCQVRVAPPASGKDATDWIAAGATHEVIQATIDAACDCEAGGDSDEATEEHDRPAVTILTDEMSAALERECAGTSPLVTLGLSELDSALGGGVAFGEIVLVAARPSHGKSLVGLQFIHHWTELGHHCAFCSEEMANESVGSRALAFATEMRKEDWVRAREDVASDIEDYRKRRATAHVIRRTSDLAKLMAILTALVLDQQVRCVVVDYAQQLAKSGKGQFEAVTEVSKALTDFTRQHKVVMVALVQHSRDIEGRDKFIPRNTDLKSSGQLEQDADVILHLVWPWQLDRSNPKDLYQIYIGKNRERGIHTPSLTVSFEPDRQRIVSQPITKHTAYNPSLDNFNRG